MMKLQCKDECQIEMKQNQLILARRIHEIYLFLQAN